MLQKWPSLKKNLQKFFNNKGEGHFQLFGSLFSMKAFLSEMEISDANLQMMPGFRLSWYYTGIDFKADPLLEYPVMLEDYTIQYKDNKEFIREAKKKPSCLFIIQLFHYFLDL